MFSVCLITLSGFLFTEIPGLLELMLKHPLSGSSVYRFIVRRNTVCFQIWLLLLRTVQPLPGLCSERNSEPPNPTQPLCISHESVALLLHPSFSHLFSRQKSLAFPRQKTFHTFWIIPAALLSNILKSTNAFVHGKRIYSVEKLFKQLFLNVSRLLTDHGMPS